MRSVPDDGGTHEATYLQWLDWLKEVAESPVQLHNVKCPACWVPFLWQFGHTAEPFQMFPIDAALRLCVATDMVARVGLRRTVEIFSTMRPELVHAQYECDTGGWNTRPMVTASSENIVTCNASFFRAEFLDYIENFNAAWRPQKPVCVICPCAADKPYPSPLHKAIIEALDGLPVEIVVVSGVLGFVPQSMWDESPSYDAGLPNGERVREQAEVLANRLHESPLKPVVVLYTDYIDYAETIKAALKYRVSCVDPLSEDRRKSEYLRLDSPVYLSRLATFVKGVCGAK